MTVCTQNRYDLDARPKEVHVMNCSSEWQATRSCTPGYALAPIGRDGARLDEADRLARAAF